MENLESMEPLRKPSEFKPIEMNRHPADDEFLSATALCFKTPFKMASIGRDLVLHFEEGIVEEMQDITKRAFLHYIDGMLVEAQRTILIRNFKEANTIPIRSFMMLTRLDPSKMELYLELDGEVSKIARSLMCLVKTRQRGKQP